MHPYIPHLLEDIAAAHRTEDEAEEYYPQTFEEEMEEVERWVSEDPPHSFGYYCGLQAEQFPPAGQLADEDMKLVCDAFDKMMQTWNLDIDFPDNIPIPFAYKLTVDTLNRKTMIAKSGFVSFDFCTGYAPDCELKEFCPCLKYWNETADEPTINENENENDIPF